MEEVPSEDQTDSVQNIPESQTARSLNATGNKEETTAVKSDCLQKMNDSNIDFTADITLDQLDTTPQKEITDEDVMRHLDEIENIVIDSATFGKNEDDQTAKPTKDSSKEEPDIIEIPVKEEEVIEIESNDENPKTEDNTANEANQEGTSSVEVSWYERKLTQKVTTVRERMSKLARVLEFSYPCYKDWLGKAERKWGSAICKLDSPRRCSLNKPYSNRWKFICSRKNTQHSAKDIGDTECSAKSSTEYGTSNKNVETVWHLEPTGAWGVNVNNEFEFPPFVLRAVKIFEDFLQTTEQLAMQESLATTECFTDDVYVEVKQERETTEGKQQWLWLLVRCNSSDELMLFATGKNISCNTMDRLKEVYESGPGKDCNVKSLYCKSINKCHDTTVTNTTFLVGSEALDEIVGGIKIQLAPKTNFWSNAEGANNVARTVMELLAPTAKTTVLEIGCGIGLIGLMMASKCRRVVGVDAQSEVEEAEMICELNNIKNASFIMGSPSEVTNKISNTLKYNKTYAVINATTNIGRALEIMTCLRKSPTVRRLVMVTTLTKQSVRAILELARPADRSFGLPFIPVRACVVDTLPVGPHFEIIILMERRLVYKSPWLQKPPNMEVTPVEMTSQGKVTEQSFNNSGKKETAIKTAELQAKKNNVKTFLKKKMSPAKGTETNIVKSSFKEKRPHTPEQFETVPKKYIKKTDKVNCWRPDMPKKKKDWIDEGPQLRINPLYEKKVRENRDQQDLRERLSNNRVDVDIVQKVKEHQALLEVAKEKLSGPAPTVDVDTAKQLQNMLSMVLEQTTKLQSQLPRSVWDRIAPPESAERASSKQSQADDPLLKGRVVQGMGTQDILITTANKSFLEDEEPDTKPPSRKHQNIPPLEPNLLMPTGFRAIEKSPERHSNWDFRKQATNQGNSWNRDKPFERNSWDAKNLKKGASPVRRQISPRHGMSPPRRLSPKRPLLSPPKRMCSPPRRHFSPLRRPSSPFRPRDAPMRHQFSPPRRLSPPARRMMSPARQTISPPRRPMSPVARQTMSPPRRPMTPLRRPSPSHRPISMPLRSASPQYGSKPYYDAPSSSSYYPTSPRPMSPVRQSMVPMRRPMSPKNQQSFGRMGSPVRHEIMPPRPQNMPYDQTYPPMKRRAVSPHSLPRGRPLSPPPPRALSPARRRVSPQRPVDDWDIPNRGTAEQNVRSSFGERLPEKIWRDKWDTGDSSHGRDWTGGRGDNWSGQRAKLTSAKPGMKEQWNIRGKESFSGRDEPWRDNSNSRPQWEPAQSKDLWNQSDKDDWNDLPEDARDPWGDDANLGVKDRWMKFDNPGPSSSWNRDNKPADEPPSASWQSKPQHLPAKPQWPGSNNQNLGESRWMGPIGAGKKFQLTSSWRREEPWRAPNSNFASQRSFVTSNLRK